MHNTQLHTAECITPRNPHLFATNHMKKKNSHALKQNNSTVQLKVLLAPARYGSYKINIWWPTIFTDLAILKISAYAIIYCHGSGNLYFDLDRALRLVIDPLKDHSLWTESNRKSHSLIVPNSNCFAWTSFYGSKMVWVGNTLPYICLITNRVLTSSPKPLRLDSQLLCNILRRLVGAFDMDQRTSEEFSILMSPLWVEWGDG